MNEECIDICRGLEAWYGGVRGDYVLQATHDALAPILDLSFGYHLLQVGLAREPALYDSSPIRHRIQLAPECGSRVGLVGEVQELPLASDSIDTLISHHALEFADNPHQALREMQRVLAPQGHLLLIGFNPYSLQGAANSLRGRFSNPLWKAHKSLSKTRLTDWLHLLGCEVESVTNLYAIPTLGSGRLRRSLEACDDYARRHNWPLGGIYVMHAIKQVRGINPSRQALRAARRRLIGLVPKPATPATPTPREGNVAA